MSEQERWEPGDVALGADGVLWARSSDIDTARGKLWTYSRGTVPKPGQILPGGQVSDSFPARPLTLLVRNGQACSGILTTDGDPVPVWVVKASTAALESQLYTTSRTCTRCGDGDLYPRRCSQCGQRWIDLACGPTHALIKGELGLMDCSPGQADEIEVMGGVPVVHSHADAPCSRCGVMDIHTVEECARATIRKAYRGGDQR